MRFLMCVISYGNYFNCWQYFCEIFIFVNTFSAIFLLKIFLLKILLLKIFLPKIFISKIFLPKIFPHLLLFTTYILLPTLFIPCLKLRGGQTEDELTDRTHTHIVSFIVLDLYLTYLIEYLLIISTIQ